MQKQIKNIIFDLGAVLVNLDIECCVRAFEHFGAENVASMIKNHHLTDLILDTELGNIDQQTFCNRVRLLVEKNLSDKDIIGAWNALLTGIPNKKKQRLLDLRKQYNIFLLSNTNYMHWQKCANDFFPYKGFGVKDYFNAIFLSYEMHLYKPNPDIFKEVLLQANIVAKETLFVDDRAENCLAASKLGIHTYQNEHPDDWLTVEALSI